MASGATESLLGRQRRVNEATVLLKNAYPNARIALTNWKNPWELLVAVVLSAQCTDVMVNRVTEKLFTKYRTLEDYVQTNPAEFEQDIKSTGFFRHKAQNILTTAKLIKERFGGKVPRAMEDLLTLPGVARKTANIILGNAYGIVAGIAVDTHVQRISQRLRLVDLGVIGGKREMMFKKDGKRLVDYKKDADPGKIEQQLMEVVAKEDWFRFTYLIIDHGRAVCKAQNPDCTACVLAKLCPTSRI